MCLGYSDAPPLLALAAWARRQSSYALLAWSCSTLPSSLNPTSFWMNVDELQLLKESGCLILDTAFKPQTAHFLLLFWPVYHRPFH